MKIMRIRAIKYRKQRRALARVRVGPRVRQERSLIYARHIEWVSLQRSLTARAFATSHETLRMNHCAARSAAVIYEMLTGAPGIQRRVYAEANYLFYYLYLAPD
jgi:hypothetical protein